MIALIALSGYDRMVKNMRQRTLFITLCTFLLLVREAHADRQLLGTAALSTGFSDNILGVPETDDPTSAQVEADLFFNISPGAQLSIDKRSAFHLLNYQLTIRAFTRNSEANSISNQFTHQSNFFRTPVTTVNLNSGIATGVINTIDRTGPFLQDQVTELPTAGGASFFNGFANAGITHQMNIDWSSAGSGGFRFFRRFGQANPRWNFIFPGQVSIQKNFRRHNIGASLNAAYSASTRNNPGQTDALAGGPRAFWTWDVSEGWSSFVSLGSVIVLAAPEFDAGFALPTGRYTLSYTKDQAFGSMTYSYGANANVFTGDLQASHRVTGRLGLPVPWVDNVAVTAAAGYRRGRFLNLDLQELTGRTEQFTASLSSAYQFNPSWAVSGRIQLNRQLREDALTGAEFGIARRTVNVFFTGTWPNTIRLIPASQGNERVDEQNDAAQIER